ncbi:hypothetical protein FLW16_19795 [Microbispora sp. KK1-11]|nr:hypothetical protein FLW16_19795 [Microbispora sp. KK1-11]
MYERTRGAVVDYFAGDPRTNRERMLAGDLYIADDPESARRAGRRGRGDRRVDPRGPAAVPDPDTSRRRPSRVRRLSVITPRQRAA